MSQAVSNTKTRVAVISVVASATMAATKFVVGVAIGSLALISEALHSSVDLVATVVTWLVVTIVLNNTGTSDTASVRIAGIVAAVVAAATWYLSRLLGRTPGKPPTED